jgi:predicted ATPase
MSDTSFITRVALWNYRSIRSCSVSLGPLTFLVGPNGAGKSNFLDALRLVSDSLRANLRQAIELRGGVREMSFRAGGAGRPDAGFGVRLEFALPPDIRGWYAVRIGIRANESAIVEREECHWSASGSSDQEWYAVSEGRSAEGSDKTMPVVADDQLYLLRASSIPSFRPVYDALSRMAFYNLNPDAMRGLQPAGAGENLKRDGANLSAVLDLLAVEAPDAKRRILEFLTCLAPGIDDVIVQRFDAAKKAMLTFKRTAPASRAAVEFASESMSDGELRALGVLTALFQSWLGGAGHVPLVGIEEPESALHPRSASALRDALISGSASTQVVVTTHSPEILDDKDVSPDWILGVANEDGTTRIAPIGEADRSVLRDRLLTAGELLKQGQLEPGDTGQAAGLSASDLFRRGHA